MSLSRITLVGTVHRGSEDELVRILEAISPDLIFEESRPSDFEAWYRNPARYTPEMRAICRYLKMKPARQVPVDGYAIPNGFRGEMISLENFVRSNSLEYCELTGAIDARVDGFGFRFLNSLEYEALSRKEAEIFEKIIGRLGSEAQRKQLSMWNDQIRKREAVMVGNIRGFCGKTPFKEGVFLVGAAHIPAILKLVEGSTMEGGPVEWRRLQQ